QRRSRFGYRTYVTVRQRRLIASQTEKRTAANERRRQRMAQMRVKRRSARLEEARLRARQSSSAASGLLPLEESEPLRVAERRQKETENQRRTGLHAQQSRDFNRLAFRYNPADNYSLNPHVLIVTMNEVCRCCKALKFKAEARGMCCAAGKIKLTRLEEPPEPLKTLLAGYNAQSKRFLSKIRKYNSCSK
ncbi:unnamed protein product, partial [Onchocerca ochengi]|uniref:POP1 domain-containing protein n=1 Tax=Onchocerca ochengi TaxID=42157 RepID=A0A182EY83_ONCOC